MKKLSKEIVNQELESKNRNVRLIGEYVNSRTKSLFKCLSCDNNWLTKPNDVMNGSGCHPCSGKKRLTKEEFNDHLERKNRPIRIIGVYLNGGTKSTFQCLLCDHQWEASPHHIRQGGGGCPHCGDTAKLTAEIVNSQLESENRPVRMIGEYVNTQTKSLFECLECNNQWLTSPARIRKGCGCPKCAKSGYKIDKPGWIYILKFANFIKYGITNNLKQRLKRHEKNGIYSVVLSQLHYDGTIAFKIEQDIKSIFGGKFTTRELCPDGWTETLCLSKLDDLLNYCRRE